MPYPSSLARLWLVGVWALFSAPLLLSHAHPHPHDTSHHHYSCAHDKIAPARIPQQYVQYDTEDTDSRTSDDWKSSVDSLTSYDARVDDSRTADGLRSGVGSGSKNHLDRDNSKLKLSNRNVEDTNVSNEDIVSDSTRTRSKRAARSLYKPMRIQVEWGNMKVLHKRKEKDLKRIVQEVIKEIQNIFSVIRVSGNLTLKRDHACVGNFPDGRCSSHNTSYKGEFCQDFFQIPDKDLEVVDVYRHINSTTPWKQFNPGGGTGFPQKDIVFYVQSVVGQCNAFKGLDAYASVCRKDQNNRPIAGYLNFCPSYIMRLGVTEDHIRTVVRHEILHALGFSSQLFKNYMDCNSSVSGLNCTTRFTASRSYQHQINGYWRLNLPTVTREYQQFSGCNASSFSPPLDNQTGSHWHPAVMYGSIMAPYIDLSQATYFDNLTLAVLEDSGWYAVDRSATRGLKGMAEGEYLWGKDSICNFGNQCANDTEYFCAGQLNTVGCHQSHMYKATCQTDSHLPGCAYRRPTAATFCLNSGNKKTHSVEDFGSNSRCFYSNVTSTSSTPVTAPEGMCLRHRCSASGDVEIEIGKGMSAAWVSCANGTQWVTAPGYSGVVECPGPGIMCTVPTTAAPSTVTTSSPGTTGATTFVGVWKDPVVSVKLYFASANYTELQLQSIVPQFEQMVINEVVFVTKIQPARITNMYSKAGSISVYFNFQGASTPSGGVTAAQAYALLAQSVTWRKFSLSILAKAYTADSIEKLETEDPIQAQILSALQVVAIIIGLLVLIGLVLAAVFIGYRQKQMRLGRVSPCPSRDGSIDLQTRQSVYRIASARSVQLEETFSPGQVAEPALTDRVLIYKTTTVDSSNY